jgi:ribonuclease HI
MKKRKRSPQESSPNFKTTTKYYAVAQGRIPAVYTSWQECQTHVKGYKGAVYKRFAALSEAEAFVQSHAASLVVVPSDPAVNETTAATTLETVVPPIALDSFSSPVSTVMIPAGSSITIAATAPTAVTIQVMGPPSSDCHVKSTAPPSFVMTHASTTEPILPSAAAVVSSQERPPVTATGGRVHLWFDGGSRGNPGVVAGAGAVVIVMSPAMDARHVRLFLNGTRSDPDHLQEQYTNNEAEYAALIVALQVLLDALPPLRLDALEIRGDSQLVLHQLTGVYDCKSPRLQSYHRQARALLQECVQRYLTPMDAAMDRQWQWHPHLRLCHVPRAQNQTADGTCMPPDGCSTIRQGDFYLIFFLALSSSTRQRSHGSAAVLDDSFRRRPSAPVPLARVVNRWWNVVGRR